MTEQSEYLVALARRIVQPYTLLPTCKAAMVTGSAAKGLSDNYSDLDLTIYYAAELPSEDDLALIRQTHGAAERKWLLGDPAEGAFAEAYDLYGIEVQIGHTTIANWEADIDKVLVELACDTPLQKAMEGTLACQALYGATYIQQWQARLAAYPPALAEAMVKNYLTFFPLWGLGPHFRTRNATIWYYQTLVESTQHLVGVLAGLNHLYFTTFQFKRMGRFLQQMAIAPHNLADRLEGLFTSEQAIALADLEALVAETITLVETYMPTVDTTRAKRRLGWRQQPWQAVA